MCGEEDSADKGRFEHAAAFIQFVFHLFCLVQLQVSIRQFYLVVGVELALLLADLLNGHVKGYIPTNTQRVDCTALLHMGRRRRGGSQGEGIAHPLAAISDTAEADETGTQDLERLTERSGHLRNESIEQSWPAVVDSRQTEASTGCLLLENESHVFHSGICENFYFYFF